MINNGGAATTTVGGMEGGRSKMGNVQGLKKGPWTAAEDAILIEYVKKHGEGNWNSVQKNSGLMRCGKSCRLRWANHLRPNLKKGSFTPEEERIIIDLHAKLGNKWARMASQLPGRTDNEIKNFWNTRMKRRQRAGLPIYPQEFQEEANSFHLHNQQHDQQKHPNSSSSSSPFSNSLLSSSRKVPFNNNNNNNNPSPSFLDHPINFQNHLSASFFSNPTFQIKSFPDNNGSSALPLSPVSQYGRSPPCSTSFYQSFPGQAIPSTPPPSIGYNSTDLENMSFTSLIMGAHVEPIGQFISGLKPELPSNQITHFPSMTGDDVRVGEESSKNTDNDDSETALTELQDNRNSGLLDALLLESHHLSSKEKISSENNSSLVVSDKGKHVANEPADDENECDEDEEKEGSKRVKLSSINAGEASCENHYSDDITSSQSSIGMKQSEEPINSMDDDDLSSLLDNFPSSTPLPDWYRSRNMSNETKPTSDVRGGKEEDRLETQPTNGGEDTTNVEWAFGSSYWNNMPSIC